jgi:hypothetical protein
MGVILIMVAFIMFAVVLDSVDTLLSWTGAGGTTLADFTGLEAIITIAPLLIFIGLLAGGGWLTFQGLRSEGGGKAGRGLH